MATQTQNPDFTTVLTKDFYTVLFKGEALFTIIPLQAASPKRQVTLNYVAAQEHIKALQAGVSPMQAAQTKYNELNSQNQF